MNNRTLIMRNPNDYTDTEEIVAEYEPLHWQERGLSYTATGYGKKIPTGWTVHYRGRRRRVYCTVYSNAGTCWIVVDGQRMIVD